LEGSATALHLLIWPDYIPQEVVQGFAAQEGVEVVIHTFESPEEALSILRAGGGKVYSVVVIPDCYVLPLVREGVIGPLDLELIPHRANLDPLFLFPPYDPLGIYSVPYLWGTTGLAYRSDLVEEIIDSYAVLFDPQRQIGSFLLLDDMRETIGAALRYLGYSANTIRAEALDKAKALLLSAKARSQGFASSAEAIERLLAGEVVVALVYSGDVLFASDPRLFYVIPAEGGTIWVDVLVVPQAAPLRELAHRFINYLLMPEVAAAVSNYTHYATPVAAALPFVAPDLSLNPIVFPPAEVLARLEYLLDLGEDLNMYEEIWQALKAEQP
jgi:spermidine/putrescine transport system substrate-binding protein